MQLNPKQSIEEIQNFLGVLPEADVPVALLPIRLETRFTTEDGKIYLCVRIYPDDLHLDTHEPLLTEEEVQWGKQLWEQTWLAGRDPAMEKAIQDELAERFGAGRAAWIVKTLKPLNPQDRSDEPNRLPVKPIYPEVEIRTDTWTSPPQVQALPNYWVLCGYRGHERVLTSVTNPVDPNLTAGFDPEEPDPSEEQGRLLLEQRDDNTVLPLDERMKWMVDFDEAVTKGMGFRIELASQQEAEEGYDRIVVLGLDSTSSAQTLESLLASQRYTDSLDFVPQGTPSNNTEAAAAGYSETEPELETELLSQKREAPGTPDCNCHVAAKALGIASETFAELPHTGDREQADAQAMNTVLWPATWGYFFRYILHHVNGHLSDATIELLRSYFIKFVRARGPIPALRVGQQPYGILPVTSLELYQPNEVDEQEVFSHQGIAVLKTLRDRWQASLDQIPKVMSNEQNGDMAQTLADILGMLPVSDTMLGRMALDGILYGVPELGPSGLPVSQDDAVVQRYDKAISELNSLSDNLNLSEAEDSIPGASLVFTEPIYKMHPDPDASEQEVPSELFIRIQEATFSSLSNGFLNEAEKQNPLALLLRHSMLLAYLDTAYHLNRAYGLVQPEDHQEPSLVGILTDPQTNQVEQTPTLTQLLERAPDEVGLSAQENSLADIIHTLDTGSHESAKILDDMRESLDHLATVPLDQLAGLLGETLDLASHRLDAWITSLATARLDSLRQQQPQGVILGGYGWVENLKLKPTDGSQPGAFGDRIPVQEIPKDESENGRLLYENKSNGGFVTAPSLNQAAAAAILRSGYLNHKTQDDNAPFAIDLSSERVRLAKWLLDGVRQGQPLGALLGYRFERQLHEHRLAEYILPFRKLVPFGDLVRQETVGEEEEANFIANYHATHLTPTDIDREAIETIEAQHVVDGLALMQLRQEGKLRFGPGKNEINVLAHHLPQIEAHLDQLAATVDAISDLVTAESVYQLIQGNELLAGGTLDAIAKGEAPPPNPEIVHTPRSGVAHTHRVPIILSGDIEPVDTWQTDSFQQRAILEPNLNHWLAQLL